MEEFYLAQNKSITAFWKPPFGLEEPLPVPTLGDNKFYMDVSRREVFEDLKVKKVDTIGSVTFALTKTGKLYVHGHDKVHYGFFGISDVYKTEIPIHVPFSMRVESIS